MSNVICNLEPKLVFKYFEEISQIPRGSKDEKAISDYLYNFGKNLGLETIQDDALNIIIKKPATPGYENAPGVILQGHMDMVCEKNKGTAHDFSKDPIELKIDNDMIYANNTTLGADNGIAVAMSMAVLASNDIEHPAIEVLVTTDEETGMSGAMAVDGSIFKGKYLLNLDSEEEGYLLVSCAGGVTSLVNLPITHKDVDKSLNAYSIEINGLQGGNSGMDIIKQKGNSNKLIGRALNLIQKLQGLNFDLVEVNGGSKNNAIPRESEAIILISKNDEVKLKNAIDEIQAMYSNEFKTSDSGVRLTCKEVENNYTKAYSDDSKKKVVQMLNVIPNGVQTMSMDIKDLVESSTNLGVVRSLDNHVEFESATRSSVKTLKNEITNSIELLAQTLGAKQDLISDYPAWEYNKNSQLKQICIDVYKNMTGKEPVVMALHAGLECGLLLEKMPNVDAISLGPD
ncbi:MAG TPA: aminoacyl-histidine dipeptidase, partial [Peptostreptococcaceae bacterium]|nr:aminoacyl-histidine dipeptidase [Peptostreptococcaceae bacterium]